MSRSTWSNVDSYIERLFSIDDKVVRDGALADQNNRDQAIEGVRRYLEQAAADEQLETTVMQTVGSKGYDGLAISLVRQ